MKSPLSIELPFAVCLFIYFVLFVSLALALFETPEEKKILTSPRLHFTLARPLSTTFSSIPYDGIRARKYGQPLRSLLLLTFCEAGPTSRYLSCTSFTVMSFALALMNYRFHTPMHGERYTDTSSAVM